MEYFIKQQISILNINIDQYDLSEEYFHICATSEDINNLSYSLIIKDSTESVILPALITI